MRGRFRAVLDRYGQKAAVTSRRSGKTAETLAFIQPITRRREEIPVTATPLGAVSDLRWLYLGSAGTALEPGDRVVWNSLRLDVQEARAVCWKDDIAYYWALLRPAREATE